MFQSLVNGHSFPMAAGMFALHAARNGWLSAFPQRSSKDSKAVPLKGPRKLLLQTSPKSEKGISQEL